MTLVRPSPLIGVLMLGSFHASNGGRAMYLQVRWADLVFWAGVYVQRIDPECGTVQWMMRSVSATWRRS